VTTANASSGMNIGANVNLSTTQIKVGNATVNSVITSTAIDTDGTLSVLGAATLSNTLSVTGAANTLSTLGISGAANALSTLGVTGAATLSNTISVTGNATFSNTIGVTGAVTLSNTLSVTGAATFNTDYVITVTANADIGTANAVVLSFPKATYSTAKLMVQAKKGTVTQMTEVIIAHDSTTARSTTYGTVVSPSTNNGIVNILSAINSANVEITAVQLSGTTNTAIKIVAHLIK
jgi:hypothetical protein